MDKSKGKIVNCFYDGCHSGFGDFLRGCIHLYDRCPNHNLDFEISLKYHPISEYLRSKSDFEYEIEDIRCLDTELTSFYRYRYHESINERLFSSLVSCKEGQTQFLFSNFSFDTKLHEREMINHINNSPKLSEDCSEWFQHNLVFDKCINEAVESKLLKHKLKSDDYNIIHFRLGDKRAFFADDPEKDIGPVIPKNQELLKICLDEIENTNKSLVVLADCNEIKLFLKEEFKKKNVKGFVFHCKSGHTQSRPDRKSKYEIKRTKENLFYTAFDIKLVSMANNVKSFSVYSWGSGFISWVCKVYNVPFLMQKI